MSSETLLISGDFNIHVDVPTGADGIRFRDLLDSVGSLQRKDARVLTNELGEHFAHKITAIRS